MYTHQNDTSLGEPPGSTATWPLIPPDEEEQGYRYIKIQQNGKNASNQTYYMSLSGFEIYGKIVSVVEDMGKWPKEILQSQQPDTSSHGSSKKKRISSGSSSFKPPPSATAVKLRQLQQKPPTLMAEPSQSKTKSSPVALTIGTRVVRGPDWKWRDQDGNPAGEGKID